MNSFRQVCDKPCANSISYAEWSPLRDLIAVVTSNGDVRLHRMYWQKVWVIAAKDHRAKCLAWKSNGKLLAIGYDNGDVNLVEIERAVVIHTLKHCEEEVSTLTWSENPSSHEESSNDEATKVSFSEDILPEIKKEELKDRLRQGDSLLTDNNRYCFLVVGTAKGNVYLYLEAVLSLLTIKLGDHYGQKFQRHCIASTHLSLQDGVLTAVSKSLPSDKEQESYYVHQFQCARLFDRRKELMLLCVSYCKVHFLVQRCEELLQHMLDSSEDISLKINTKLEKLEGLLNPSQTDVSTEFIAAYATGRVSDELQSFLTQNLTTKGLKQIEQNVQAAYASMRTNISDELEVIVQHLNFRMFELTGMSRWTERYESIGVEEPHIGECFQNLVQFALGLLRLLEAISNDMQVFSVFFAWLTSLCVQFSGEAVPSFPQLSFKDYDIMLDFLEHRLQKLPTGLYDVERVSRFFKRQDGDTFNSLKSQVINSDSLGNVWTEFLKKNSHLKDLPFIVTPDDSSTLQDLFEHFTSSYQKIFTTVCKSIDSSVSLSLSVNLFQAAADHEDFCRTTFSFVRKCTQLHMCVLACCCDSDRMFYVKLSSHGHRLAIGGVSIEPGADQSLSEKQYTMKSIQFYNLDNLTILFEESNLNDNDVMATTLAQLPLDEILDVESNFVYCDKSIYSSLNPEGIMDNSELEIPWLNVLTKFSQQRRIENFRGKFASLNGYTRKVCALVSISGRRVRIFDMASNDLDDEDEDGGGEDENETEVKEDSINISSGSHSVQEIST